MKNDFLLLFPCFTAIVFRISCRNDKDIIFKRLSKRKTLAPRKLDTCSYFTLGKL